MQPVVSPHLQRVLNKLGNVRASQDGWLARCPCPDHGQDGDQHPSLRIALGEDGRVLLKCRVGCMTDEVLNAIGLDYDDLFASDGAGETSNETTTTVVVRSETNTSHEKADPDLCDRAYRLLLEKLPLSDEHRDDLHRRGLTDAEIDKRGYRSMRNIDRGLAAKAVHQQLGDTVLGVPGFIQGEYGITLQGDATGLLVPVRDLQGRVAALKIRRPSEPKYVYLTGGPEGVSPGSPVHIPLGLAAPATVVRLTEGELKADVSMALDGTPTIGVPGVTQWRPAISLLKELGAKTVVLAFDSPDVQTKPPVFEQTEALYRELIHEGFEVEMEDWDELQIAAQRRKPFSA